MTDEIYTLENGQQTGPFTAEQLNLRLANAEINSDLPAFRAGMSEWAPLGTLLSAAPANVQPPLVAKVQYIEGNKVRITAINLSFFDWVALLLKVALAAIPASILYFIIVGLFAGLPLMLLLGVGSTTRSVFDSINSQLQLEQSQTQGTNAPPGN